VGALDIQGHQTKDFAFVPRIVYFFDWDVGRVTASSTLKWIGVVAARAEIRLATTASDKGPMGFWQ
jgi:hypothetical protein